MGLCSRGVIYSELVSPSSSPNLNLVSNHSLGLLAVVVYFFLYESSGLSLEHVDEMYCDPECKPWNSRSWAPRGYKSRRDAEREDADEVEDVEGLGLQEGHYARVLGYRCTRDSCVCRVSARLNDACNSRLTWITQVLRW